DQLEWVLWYAPWLSDQLEWICGMLHGLDLHTTNYDQLYSYLKQHEAHANETCLMREGYQDLLAFVANYKQLPLPFKTEGLLCNKFKGGKDKVMMAVAIRGNATSYGGNNARRHARVVKCYNCQGEGHMARQCTQPKRLRNAAWFKEKAIQAAQTTIPNTVAFQTEDLDAYDSDCDDVFNAKAVLIYNLSNYDNEITSDSNIIPYSQYLLEMQQAAVQDTNLYAQQDSMILSVIEQIQKFFYDDTHKQALGYQNPFYLKKAQPIKPTLYDGSVISSQHAASPVIDDEETLILEEEMLVFIAEKEESRSPSLLNAPINPGPCLLPIISCPIIALGSICDHTDCQRGILCVRVLVLLLH
ncbi:retrovirus-related pol polyprotein from transposon TNT 1-94, partial [Tanacetum coccineum]